MQQQVSPRFKTSRTAGRRILGRKFLRASKQLRERLDHELESHQPMSISRVRGMCKLGSNSSIHKDSPSQFSRRHIASAFDQVWRSRQELLEIAGTVPLADREDFQHVSDTPQEFLESWFQTSNNCCLRPRPADVCCISMKNWTRLPGEPWGNQLLFQSTCFACTI